MIDYIRLKAEVQELESKQLDWTRRLEIAELEEKQNKSQRSNTQMSVGNGSTRQKIMT